MSATLILGISTFLAVQLGGAVWFASKMNAVVLQLISAVRKLEDEIRKLNTQATEIAVLQERSLFHDRRISILEDAVEKVQ